MKTVLHSFAFSLDFLRDQVADIPLDDMVTQPHGIRNHPAWVIGHLTHVSESLGGVIGVPPWLPDDWTTRYGTGSVPVADPAVYEAREEALAILGDAQSRITRAVEQLNMTRLEEPFPEEAFRYVFPTIAHFLTQVLVGHSAYHVGQVGVWRRAMDLPTIGRSYE